MSVLWWGLVAIYGACAGSYLGVVVDRLPAGRAVADGSRCGACGQGLRAMDNVPVLAYLWLRGRCRSCGTRILPLWWLLELTTAAIWTGCAVLLGPAVVLAVVPLAVWLLLLALALALRLGGPTAAMEAAAMRSIWVTRGWTVWAAVALPPAALTAQVVGLGAATAQRWGSFLVLGVLGAVGLVAAVLVAAGPRSQLSGPAGSQ